MVGLVLLWDGEMDGRTDGWTDGWMCPFTAAQGGEPRPPLSAPPWGKPRDGTL